MMVSDHFSPSQDKEVKKKFLSNMVWLSMNLLLMDTTESRKFLLIHSKFLFIGALTACLYVYFSESRLCLRFILNFEISQPSV